MGPTTVTITYSLNGNKRSDPVEVRTSLLDHLREALGLTGTRKGCDQGACGACTVLVDDRRVLGCLTLAVQVDDRQVITIEGIGTPDDLAPLQAAFITEDGYQCGYCTSGQICSAIGMIAEFRDGRPSLVTEDVAGRPTLTDDEIRERMSGNLCRCGAYNGIVAAIRSVALP